MHDAAVKNPLVRAGSRQLDHLLDACRGDGRASSQASDLLFALDIARVTDDFRGIVEIRIGQSFKTST